MTFRQNWKSPFFLASSLALLATLSPAVGFTQDCSTPSECSTSFTDRFEHVWGGFLHNAFTLDTPAGNEVWVVEDGGRIRHGVCDGSGVCNTPLGMQWEFQTTPFGARDLLRGIFFLDPSNGWAVGRDGWVLRTTNGGSDWTCLARVPNPCATQLPCEDFEGSCDDLYDIHMRDANEGWLIGLKQISHTLDGGLTWQPMEVVNPPPPGGVWNQSLPCVDANVEFYAVDFLFDDGDYVGIAVAQPGYIYRLDPSSPVWRRVYHCGEAPAGSRFEQLCGMTGPNLVELWDVDFARDPNLADLDGAVASVVGGIGPYNGIILTTFDGGHTWTEELQVNTVVENDVCNDQEHAVTKTLYGVAIDNNGSGFAAGYNAQHACRPPNLTGPDNWNEVSEFCPPHGLAFPYFGADSNGTGTGWVVGASNVIRHTNDGGMNYTTQSFSTAARLRDVATTGSGDVWYAGQLKRIEHSIDGGATWMNQNYRGAPGPGKRLNSIAVSKQDGMSGVAVGHRIGSLGAPTILFSSDATGSSASWQQAAVQGNADATMHAVEHASGDVFFAGGDDGVFLRSSDDGATWTAIPIQTTSGLVTDLDIEDVAFLNKSTGFLVGKRTGSSEGEVYLVTAANTTSPSFSKVATSLVASGATIQNLKGVDVVGATAYAVGSQSLAGETLPLVLAYDLSSGQFHEDATFGAAVDFPIRAGTDSDSSDWQDILNTVDVLPGSLEVFVGGSFGRVAYLDPDCGTWVEVKSQTSHHIVGMAFSSATNGYLVGTAEAQSAIVRYVP